MQLLKIIFLATIISISLISCKQKQPIKENPDMLTKKIDYKTTSITTPDEAITELKNGNKRFVENKILNMDYKQEIRDTKVEQHPHSFILSCIDSRVPAEIIFDQGIGNIFVGRVAGNVEDPNMIGSMEFATKVKNSKLIVVMGHKECGAIKGAVENTHLGYLTQLEDQIKPAITGDTTNHEQMLDETCKKNVKITIDDILRSSNVIRELIKQKKLKIVGAYYDLNTGKVSFME